MKEMEKYVRILSVERSTDLKTFSIGDIVTSDGGFYRGVIDGIQLFEDDVRIHVESDDDKDIEYFSIFELD